MINLQFSYKPVLTVNVRHKFYLNNASDDWFLVPTRDTVKQAESIGLCIKSQNGNAFLLADSYKNDAFAYKLNENDKTISFKFLLFCKNPYYLNFTNISNEILEKALFYSNAWKKDKDGSLHKDDYVNDNDLIALHSSTNEIEAQESTTYKVINEDNKSVLEDICNNNKLRIQSDFTEGKYRVLINDKEKSSFLSLGSSILKNKPLGLIEIVITPELKKEILQSISQNEPIKTKEYFIQFASKQVVWNYNIVPGNITDLSKICIEDEKQKAKFKKPVQIDLPNGKEGLQISAEKAIEMKEQFEHYFQLKIKGGAKEKVILSRLPSPALDSIRKDKKNETNISDIYIYI